VRRGKRLPESFLEQLSDAAAAASQSRALWGKWHGLMAAARALGWRDTDITAQVEEYDRWHARYSHERPCCRTSTTGGHRGTCLESTMYNGYEGEILPPAMTQEGGA
jgi:hypothetical protein